MTLLVKRRIVHGRGPFNIDYVTYPFGFEV